LCLQRHAIFSAETQEQASGNIEPAAKEIYQGLQHVFCQDHCQTHSSFDDPEDLQVTTVPNAGGDGVSTDGSLCHSKR